MDYMKILDLTVQMCFAKVQIWILKIRMFLLRCSLWLSINIMDIREGNGKWTFGLDRVNEVIEEYTNASAKEGS